MKWIVALDISRGGDEELACALRKGETRNGVHVTSNEHTLPHVRIVDDIVLVGEEEMHCAINHAQRNHTKVIGNRECGDLSDPVSKVNGGGGKLTGKICALPGAILRMRRHSGFASRSTRSTRHIYETVSSEKKKMVLKVASEPSLSDQ